MVSVGNNLLIPTKDFELFIALFFFSANGEQIRVLAKFKNRFVF